MSAHGGEVDALHCPTRGAVARLMDETGCNETDAVLYLYSRQRAIEALAGIKRDPFTLGCIDVTRRGRHSYRRFMERADAAHAAGIPMFSGMTAEPGYRAARLADAR